MLRWLRRLWRRAPTPEVVPTPAQSLETAIRLLGEAEQKLAVAKYALEDACQAGVLASLGAERRAYHKSQLAHWTSQAEFCVSNFNNHIKDMIRELDGEGT